ncbi:MAG: SLC13/DASS family transporter [Phycisphaerae bacterium]|nr:SLC13/DASS family transporter [Phycisphaerae bacterium]
MTGREVGTPLVPRWLGLLLGPLSALALWLVLPSAELDGAGQLVAGLTPEGRLTIAAGAWLAAWWLTEAIPIEAAGLLPLALFPVLGVATMRQAAAPFANEVIFLFMGGMLLGAGLERWGLHRRIALSIMLAVGTRPDRLIAGIMLATAFISMWVSNTATAVMMLPIAASVVRLVIDRSSASDLQRHHFGSAAMLAVAYSASIGGVATLIGTPPNGVMAAFIKEQYGESISFARWLGVGLPTVIVLLPAAWLLLTRALFRLPRDPLPDAAGMLHADLAALGPMGRGERSVLIVFACAALAWIFREPLSLALGLYTPRAGRKPDLWLTDAGIAIIAALTLFVLPAGRRTPVLDWATASRIPWGVLLLFGGGLSLADAVTTHGVDEAIGRIFQGLAGVHPIIIVLAVTAVVVFVTEIGSNTAVTTTFLPVVAAVALKLGVPPYPLAVAVALSASCAFMMPSGTPPNALVFSAGHLRVHEMVKAGFWLNLVSIATITGVAYWLVGLFLGGLD